MSGEPTKNREEIKGEIQTLLYHLYRNEKPIKALEDYLLALTPAQKQDTFTTRDTLPHNDVLQGIAKFSKDKNLNPDQKKTLQEATFAGLTRMERLEVQRKYYDKTVSKDKPNGEEVSLRFNPDGSRVLDHSYPDGTIVTTSRGNEGKIIERTIKPIEREWTVKVEATDKKPGTLERN